MVAAAEPVASTAVFESLVVASLDDDNDVLVAAAVTIVIINLNTSCISKISEL